VIKNWIIFLVRFEADEKPHLALMVSVHLDAYIRDFFFLFCCYIYINYIWARSFLGYCVLSPFHRLAFCVFHFFDLGVFVRM